MTKNKQQKNNAAFAKVKQRVGRGSRRQKAGMGSGGTVVSATDAKLTAALTNPFSPHANGARLPDDDSSNSIAFTIKWQGTHDTDANGRSGWAVMPHPDDQVTTANTFTAGSITTWNAAKVNTPDWGPINVAISGWRIVSYGFRVYSALPPTEQSGYARLVTVESDPSGGAFNANGGFYSDIQVQPVADLNLHWVGKPQGVDWKSYHTSGSEWGDYNGAVVLIEGAPANKTAAFIVEYVMHLECQTAIGSITNSLATPSEEHKPHVLAASDKVRRATVPHNGTTQSFTSKLWNFGKQALMDVASAALPGLYGKGMRMLTGALGSQQRLTNGPTILEVD
jgi:hypothetical protein